MKHLLVALSIIAIAATAGAETFPEISLKALKKAMSKNEVTIVDANGTKSYREAHIPNAIDYYAHKKNLSAVLPSNKKALIVTYCSSKACGAWANAAEPIRALGYKNVKHFKPGLAGWRAAGEPVSKGAEKHSKGHVVLKKHQDNPAKQATHTKQSTQ